MAFMDDGSEVQANRGYTIGFKHIPTGKCVSFKGFVTSFGDTYTSDWNSETVYGRMDPIDVFRGTRRTISLSWVAVASDEQEAVENLTNVGLLIKMLYPTYAPPSTSQKTMGPSVMEQPPLLKLRFVNWAKSMNNTVTEIKGGGSENKGWWGPSNISQCFSGGLLGHLGGMAFNPDFEAGFFDFGGELYPKQINLSGEYTVLHEHLMGWYKAGAGVFLFGKDAGHNFPYGKATASTGLKKQTAKKSKKKIQQQDDGKLEKIAK